jgi:high-affinity nickel-transport protein
MYETNSVKEKGIKESLWGLSIGDKATILIIYVLLAVITGASVVAATIIGHTYVVLAGMGIVALVLGLRHGVDADHIAAIDNTTRKMMQEGKRPLTVGTWFSIGHSLVVVLMVLAFIFATKAVAGEIQNAGFQSITGLLGTLVSGVFLFLIGLVNLIIVIDTYRVFKGLRNGTINQSQLDEELNKKGFMNTYLGKLFKIVEKPWQMFFVGFLFGLGFDTATEVLLIGISVGLSATSNVPLWMILILPLLFACGMVFTDSTDGIIARLAYGWAFQHPIRKVYYNLTITIISILVAFVIGGVELLQVLAGELNLTGGFWSWLNNLDFETLGFGIIAIFVIAWGASLAIYKYKGIEDTSFQETTKG